MKRKLCKLNGKKVDKDKNIHRGKMFLKKYKINFVVRQTVEKNKC